MTNGRGDGESEGAGEERVPYEPTRRKVAGVASVILGVIFGFASASIIIPEVAYKVGCSFGFLDHLHGPEGRAQCGAVWGIWRSIGASVLLALASGVFLAGETTDIGRRALTGMADRMAGVFGNEG